MICKPCAETADYYKSGAITVTPDGHKLCKGCDCQHKPVKEGQISE